MKNLPAIFALTRKGSQKAILLHSRIRGDLFLPEKFRREHPGVEAVYFSKSTVELMKDLFAGYRKIIGFCALGIMVRLIAPLLKDKTEDPAVVALDECGRFAVSVVSGHIGGANDLAGEAAEAIGAEPVITTASDVSNIVSVDLIGREFGWKLEKRENITRVSAAVINGEKVALVQTSGEKDWRKNSGPLPTNLHTWQTLEEALTDKPAALLLITDELFDDDTLSEHKDKVILYRPKSLVAGIGCGKGASPAGLERFALDVLEGSGLSRHSLRKVATIDKKEGEPALDAFAKKYNIPISYYSASQLNRVNNLPNPSEKARGHVGADGVAEPAAMLEAGSDTLVREKTIRGNVTVALARVEFN